LRSLVGTLEDADRRSGPTTYAEDATFVMFGAVLHGREEMLRRLETATVLMSSITTTPHTIEGDGRLAYVYGDFNRTRRFIRSFP
jgi:hypothetical protein